MNATARRLSDGLRRRMRYRNVKATDGTLLCEAALGPGAVRYTSCQLPDV